VQTHHTHLFELLKSEQPDPAPATAAPICVAALVGTWLTAGPVIFHGPQRQQLDALCRQIDVRKRISMAYGDGWQKLMPEQRAHPSVVSGLVAVLLANGSAAVACDVGWSLKCVNSALKALDLYGEAPHRPALQAWAREILDLAEGSGPRV
jgi:hypothetical protein